MNTANLCITLATPNQTDEYIDFLESVALWLHARGIQQWTPGKFWMSKAYYAESIAKGETWLAYVHDALVGTIRVLTHEPIVWPEITESAEDGVYVYNLAVKRDWAGRNVGQALLAWANYYALANGRAFVRLDCMANNSFLKHYYACSGFDSCGEVDATYPAPIGTLRVHRFQRQVSSDE
jgi:GNAT superfamily N-acetyltransferase